MDSESKSDKLIILKYRSPLYNKKKTVPLWGDSSGPLRESDDPVPVYIIRIDKRLRGFHRFEILVHEFLHRLCDEVFDYPGDEKIVKQIAKYARDEYKKYLKIHKTKSNIESLKHIKCKTHR